ncbi:MAG TPA: energy-coupling factor transporter transmembrane component T [Verrucomicrobiae bacterium]|nr:energy-coupling factor transporter transmembrane component T [Verrucomicrobiae bacterium]
MVNDAAHENAKLAWLLALAIALFAVDAPTLLIALLAAQCALWLASRLPVRELLAPLRRLLPFALLIALSFAFFPLGDRPDRWLDLPVMSWTLRINLAGLAVAALMCLRVYALVLASTWVQRTCPSGALVRGLRWLRLPETVAIAVDATLALLGGGPGSGMGGGRGTGGGRRHRAAHDGPGGISWADIRAGRVQAFVEVFDRGLERARRWLAERYPEMAPERLRDLSIVLALCLTVLGLKVLQVLPGIPIASGHKNVLIVPLFLYAAQFTGMRFGAFAAGTAVGIVSFLLGYGKYGVLEIAHFAMPGLLADLVTPWLRATGRAARLAQFAAAGVLLGFGRFAANALAIFLAGAPQAALIFFAPLLVSQVAFGALSCFVSVLLIPPRQGSNHQPGK